MFRNPPSPFGRHVIKRPIVINVEKISDFSGLVGYMVNTIHMVNIIQMVNIIYVVNIISFFGMNRMMNIVILYLNWLSVRFRIKFKINLPVCKGLNFNSHIFTLKSKALTT